jgi:hypothetical protein
MERKSKGIFLVFLLQYYSCIIFGSQTHFCNSQDSKIQVKMNEYNWTSDYRENYVTIPEVGLILVFVITNTNSEPMNLGTFNIQVQVSTPNQNGYNSGLLYLFFQEC